MAMENKNKTAQFDWMAFIEECKSKWVLCAISVFVCLCIGGLYAILKQPIYVTKGSVLVTQEDQSSAASEMVAQFSVGGMFAGSSSVDDELAVMKSHTVFRSTVKELGLNEICRVKKNLIQWRYKYLDAPIKITCNPSIPDTLSVALSFDISVDENGIADIEVKGNKRDLTEVKNVTFPTLIQTVYGDFELSLTKDYKQGEDLRAKIAYYSYDLATEIYQDILLLYVPNKKANMIEISTNSTCPKFSRLIVNSLIENYNKKGIAEKQIKEIKTATFIDDRLKSLTLELDDAELEIEQFKSSHQITNIGAEASFLYSKTNALENQLLNAETEFEILSIVRSFISNPNNKYSLVPYSAGLGSAGGLISGYNSLMLERLKLMNNNAKANNAAILAIEKQADALYENIIATLDKNYDTALLKLTELRKQTGEFQAKLVEIPSQEREFLNMQRQQSVKEQLYLFLLQQREETSINIANSMPRGSIVDAAYTLSKPVGLTKLVILVISFILGCCVIPTWLYLKKKMRTKFSTKEDVEQMTNIPILGEMCTSNREETLVVKSGGSSSAAELFRLIRSNLQFILGGMNDKVVVVTSTVSGEGKSFISINLAASLAMLGKKVVLVGMDIRCPKLAEYLNLKVNKGLTEYLSAQSITIDDIVIKDAMQENMDIIVAGPIPPNPSELLASSKVDHLFTALREKYDYIIVDSAPVGMVSDTFSLARISDATVYVCRANYTNLKDLEFINSLYADNRLKRISLVVNGTESKKGYGYGYGQSSK